jgi:Tol biopolymer transport system component
MIAFVSELDGDNEIFLLTLPGIDVGERDKYQLTNNEFDDSVPAWSPHGDQLAFSSDRDGNQEIYVLEIDKVLDGAQGYEPQRLTHDEGEDMLPAWSPDGSQIAFSSNRDGNWEIYVINSDGTSLRRLTDNPEKDMKLSWSPDGSQVAYDSGGIALRDIYIMEADGGNPRLLIQADGGWPAWSPNGSQIAYFGRLDDIPEIYIVNADGTHMRRITENNIDDWESSWSPDGEWLLYSSGRTADIFVIQMDTLETYRLTQDSYSSWVPIWRP